jgi:hypothetical protein
MRDRDVSDGHQIVQNDTAEKERCEMYSRQCERERGCVYMCDIGGKGKGVILRRNREIAKLALFQLLSTLLYSALLYSTRLHSKFSLSPYCFSNI